MSRVWPLYFLITIAIVGGIFAYGVAVPLYLISFIFPSARRAADRTLQFGISILMKVQPWFVGNIAMSAESFPADRGCLSISNHRSHLDVFILLSRIPGIRILSKKSLFFLPFLGLMMRLSRHIPVMRGNIESFVTAMDQVQRGIEVGHHVHIFPEMTRCQPGFHGTQEFRLAPFSAAMKSRAVIYPIVFRGTDNVWPKGRFAISFRRPVEVKVLEPIFSEAFSSAEELCTETKLRIDQALQ